LAAVSVSLANRWHNGVRPYCDQPSDDAFRIFLEWLLYRKIDKDLGSQLTLAKAWNFGAQYDIPAFQDAVMHRVSSLLSSEEIVPDAVLEAYKVTERRTLLQAVFIANLASDMRSGKSYAWRRGVFETYGLEKVRGFYLDLTEATCPVGDDAENGLPSINPADYLLMDTSK
jgi:hypothetical protein